MHVHVTTGGYVNKSRKKKKVQVPANLCKSIKGKKERKERRVVDRLSKKKLCHSGSSIIKQFSQKDKKESRVLIASTRASHRKFWRIKKKSCLVMCTCVHACYAKERERRRASWAQLHITKGEEHQQPTLKSAWNFLIGGFGTIDNPAAGSKTASQSSATPPHQCEDWKMIWQLPLWSCPCISNWASAGSSL